MWFFKKEIGLDVGKRTLKALKLKKKGSKIALDHFFFYDLAKGNDFFPEIAGLENSLKALVEVSGFKGSAVNACVDDENVLIFDLTLPEMPAADLVVALRNEIEPHLNFPIDEATLDYIVIAVEDSKLLLKVFCVRTEDVKRSVDLLSAAELEPTGMEISMLSNIATLDFNDYLDDQSFNVIVDLGETKTMLALLKGRKLIATNTLHIAMGTINRRLSEAAAMSYVDAERVKTSVTSKAGDMGPAQVIMQSVYADLLKELHRGIEFFQMSTGEQLIQTIFAIGGGSRDSSLVSAIQLKCDIEAVAINPFRNIEIISKKTSPESSATAIGEVASHMTTVVGLALRRLNAS